MGYIDKDQLLKLAESLKNTNYGKYLIELAREELNINNNIISEANAII